MIISVKRNFLELKNINDLIKTYFSTKNSVFLRVFTGGSRRPRDASGTDQHKSFKTRVFIKNTYAERERESIFYQG